MIPATKVTVRPATEKDVPAIHRVIQAAFQKLLLEPGSAKTLQALKETEEDIKKDLREKRVLLCEHGGMIAGSIRYHVVMENIAYISRFGVLPELQGCGIGGALIDAVVEECQERGLRAMALHTSSAVFSSMRFYYKMCFFAAGVSTKRGYYRALLVRELVPPDEIVDYAALFQDSGL
jgi:ribosomal protein S18 acetylase RimI-like enzyme